MRIWCMFWGLGAMGCSWVLPEPDPFRPLIEEDAMVEDARPPRPDFEIATAFDIGRPPPRFDMGPIDMAPPPPVDQAVVSDMSAPVDMAGPPDMPAQPDMRMPDMAAQQDMAARDDMAIDAGAEPDSSQ